MDEDGPRNTFSSRPPLLLPVFLSPHLFFFLLLLSPPHLSVSLSRSQSLFPNETGTVLPVGKEVSAPETNTHTQTHTVTHKSHLYYAEHQLADGGADYAVTLR